MIQRFWRFSRVALLVSLMTGCATVNDMRAQKASGLAQSYPVPPDRAWQIAHAVLDATSAVAIEEHQPAGRRPTHAHPLAVLTARNALLSARPRHVDLGRVRVGVVGGEHSRRAGCHDVHTSYCLSVGA